MCHSGGNLNRPSMNLTNQTHGARCALVTGATGYVGSRLASRLARDGWIVHVIVRKGSSLGLLKECVNRLSIHVHDGSSRRMLAIFALTKPSVVFHFAANAIAEHRAEDLDQLVVANVLFSSQVVEAMYRNETRYMVNTETFWQHYSGTDAYDPVCLYAATKQAFRDILLFYLKTSRISAISLVLYDTYGPSDPRRKLFYLLRESASYGGQVDMTPGDQIVDMTHVEDVVEAYLVAGEMLLTGKVKFETYSVSSGQRMTLRELVEVVVNATGLAIRPRWGAKQYRKNEVMVPWLGQPLPGWSPRIDLASGVREIFSQLD